MTHAPKIYLLVGRGSVRIAVDRLELLNRYSEVSVMEIYRQVFVHCRITDVSLDRFDKIKSIDVVRSEEEKEAIFQIWARSNQYFKFLKCFKFSNCPIAMSLSSLHLFQRLPIFFAVQLNRLQYVIVLAARQLYDPVVYNARFDKTKRSFARLFLQSWQSAMCLKSFVNEKLDCFVRHVRLPCVTVKCDCK